MHGGHWHGTHPHGLRDTPQESYPKWAAKFSELVERKVKHPVIGKIMTRSKKYHAHVEGLEAVAGDLVQIEECAPISKTKAWRVAKVVEKARIV